MPDKARFLGELARVAAPGGRIVVVTWCHRVLEPGEAGLKADLLALQDDRSTSMAPSAQPPPGGSAEQAKRGLGGFGSKFAQLKSQAEAKLKEAQQKK